MNRYLRLAFCAIPLFSFLFAGTLRAQRDTTKNTYNESVLVVGDYKPVLDGVTEKVNVPPAVNDDANEGLQPKFTYNNSPRRIIPLSTTTGLKAANVVASPVKLYDNYMRFGMGHDFAGFGDFNPLLDLYYTSKRHDDYAYGGRFYHQSDWTTFGKSDGETPSSSYYGRNRDSETRLNLFGKYIYNKKHLFSADVAFDRQYGRYYGFSDSVLHAFDSNLTRDVIKYRDYAFAYSNMAMNLGARSLNTDAGQFGYEAHYGIADMWAKRDFSQLTMTLDGDVHYGFPLLSKYKAVTYMRMQWEGYHQHQGDEMYKGLLAMEDYGSTIEEKVYNRHLLTFRPYADFLFKDFKVHAGFGVGVNAFDAPGKAQGDFFPDVTVTKTLSSNRVSLTAGLVGGYIANDWNSIRLYNPYIMPAPASKATVDNDLYAHLRVNFSKRLMLNVNVDNHFYKNKMFFMTDLSSLIQGLGNQFTPYYLDVECLVLGSDFTFTNDEMITATIGGDYYLYYNKEEEMPLYHTPSFVGHLDADVNYKDKWLFRLSALLVTKQEAYYEYASTSNWRKSTDDIRAHFGLSLEAEYLHSRALSFFAKVDNVTAQKYFLWANYPAQRFNLMLGLTYTLPHK